ncbi:MAG: type I DNA topoisomerase [Bacilli bacterium]|nr:type I DNA topoisomerase [Bacilli bacterium]MDD4076728.1 type I DNA topoisomerase [Bacilli bacterium]
MKNNLIIVESPAKSQTISKYLGEEFIVASSKGHIRDLKTQGYGGFGVDIENNFKPMYKTLRDKAEVIRELKKAVKKADKIYLATDPDREGEAISWHLYEVLKLAEKEYERIVFYEITKPAILKGLENGREIDVDLVHSQESRRILDRIIGFSLSTLLHKKIGSKSAGRVQSVALKLIVDREKEIQAFIPEEYWEIFIEFLKNDEKLRAKLIQFRNEKIELKSKQDADKVLAGLTDNYRVKEIVRKERKKSAKPPLITSTLQQEASTKYNFNSKRTMIVAQKLYEGIELADERIGLITYMRTDSVRLSEQFIGEAKNWIISNLGKEYYSGYRKTNKGKKVQDAHEAIRPTSLKYTPDVIKKHLTPDEYKIYSLIYYRALCTLMSDAILEDEKINIENNGFIFEISGEKVVFEGYLKLYAPYENNVIKTLPPFEVNEILAEVTVLPEQKFTSPPQRYSESRLIKKMEELGIGRPSTYSITVDTLKQRYYVRMENRSFIPTEQGILTSEKLEEYFSDIINVKYTAEMEDTLDEIALGKKIWYDELRSFYDEFKPLVAYADLHMEKIYPVHLEEYCPLCNSQLVIRNGRYGQFVACSAFPKCRYIKKEEKEEVITDVKCPNCESGYLVERVSRRGRTKGKKFYACNQYPNCKTTFSNLPDNQFDQ